MSENIIENFDICTDELTDEEMRMLSCILEKKVKKIVNTAVQSGTVLTFDNHYSNDHRWFLISDDKSRATIIDFHVSRDKIRFTFLNPIDVVDTTPTCNEDGCEIDYEKILGRKI